LQFAYLPIGILHDKIALPWRGIQEQLRMQTRRALERLAAFDIALAAISLFLTTSREAKKARADARRALAADPGNSSAWRKLGDAMMRLKRYKKAIASYDRALALAPDRLPIWRKRGAAMQAIGRPDIAIRPRNANEWAMHAGRLWVSKRFAEAAEASNRAHELDPLNVAVERVGIHSRLFACDWRRRDEDKKRVTDGLNSGQNIIDPFFHRALCDSESESFILAKMWARRFQGNRAAWNGPVYRHDKIRIAYISTDFYDHVVSDVIVGCFEHHDRARFETTAISLGPNDGSDMRHRLEAAFDRFVDMRGKTVDQVAATLRELEIDIAVDLNGQPNAEHTRAFAYRPVPLQVNFLGYPGTKGAPFFDYIIADPILIPDEHRAFYVENIAYLPNTYMPTDRKRPIATKTPSRIEEGLPETGFVFACHHPAHKLSPEMFDIWMRLLRLVDGSVLWLRANSSAVINLRREADLRNVAPERLVFAPHKPQSADHLARLRLADLYLDALPYNAHSSATDALWAGLPVLTCLGRTFAGRVGAGLLHAVGLPELATTSLAEYEALAVTLAGNPEQLAAIRARLMRNRDIEPLFDTAGFARDLESAYIMMWQRYQRGERPEGFSVPKRPATHPKIDDSGV
jgi:protein O-GlcNAc transferase